ncbi:MAG: hypothetical protein PHV87_07680 [Bacilli bacterium]|nr:hypothetical protein [Bacilli bacterium]
MKKLLIVILLIVGLLIPAVSAEIIWDYEMYEFADTGKSGTYFGGNQGATSGGMPVYNDYDMVTFTNIEKFQTLNYFTFTINGTHGYEKNGDLMDTGRHEFTYEIGVQSGPGVVYIERGAGKTKFTVFLNDWNVAGLTGAQNVIFPFNFIKHAQEAYDSTTGSNPDGLEVVLGAWLYFNDKYFYYPYPPINTHVKTSYTSGTEWKNHIIIEELPAAPLGGNLITLKRDYGDTAYSSVISIIGNDETVLYTNDGNSNINELWFGLGSVERVEVKSLLDRTYSFPISGGPDDPDDPDTADVTVYIKNSQTGALIANANVAIDALVNGEYYPVVNRTEPSGIFTINLQPTGGGKPNPDGYRLIATADGYYNPTPTINFTVDAYTKLSTYLYLDPIAGGPVNENNTFIDFFVRDMSSNPISGATVKFGKYTLITNSAGYTVFEVDKNNNYSWTISKSGYGALTGNAVIGDSPRHTINTVLAPIVTPTITTPIPTSPPIGPTPTMTAPTGEPVSNWLEWFAAHFGMILGGGVEIGKIFMWLCFTVPVGVYVGKEAKAGAAGFMAGAGIVTLFFVLIGWVPIWLVVLLALIIGLLYAKVFNSQDNGGGGR